MIAGHTAVLKIRTFPRLRVARNRGVDDQATGSVVKAAVNEHRLFGKSRTYRPWWPGDLRLSAGFLMNACPISIVKKVVYEPETIRCRSRRVDDE